MVAAASKLVAKLVVVDPRDTGLLSGFLATVFCFGRSIRVVTISLITIPISLTSLAERVARMPLNPLPNYTLLEQLQSACPIQNALTALPMVCRWRFARMLVLVKVNARGTARDF